MLSIIGKKKENEFQTTMKLDEVAMSIDDLTEQILLANKLTAAAILQQHGVLEEDEYHEFLMTVYKW